MPVRVQRPDESSKACDAHIHPRIFLAAMAVNSVVWSAPEFGTRLGIALVGNSLSPIQILLELTSILEAAALHKTIGLENTCARLIARASLPAHALT